MQAWEEIESGYVIKMANGKYVWAIIANGHPEDPVIYYTDYLWEAKTWKTFKAAMKARERVRAKAGSGDVWGFKYNPRGRLREPIEVVNE